MTNLDFTYAGTFHGTTGLPIHQGPVMKTALGSPVNVAAQTMNASAICYRIMEKPQDTWRAALAAVEPVEMQAEVRRLMTMRWETLRARARMETVGKRSEAGDQAMAAIGELARRL